MNSSNLIPQRRVFKLVLDLVSIGINATGSLCRMPCIVGIHPEELATVLAERFLFPSSFSAAFGRRSAVTLTCFATGAGDRDQLVLLVVPGMSVSLGRLGARGVIHATVNEYERLKAEVPKSQMCVLLRHCLSSPWPYSLVGSKIL